MSWSAKKLIPRLIFLLIASGLLLAGGCLAWVSSWRVDSLEALSSSSEMALTTAGPVEYLARGDGPSVLIFHGMPGGYDQAMFLGAGLIESGFQVLAPSRPGYLRTPLASGQSPAAQADAMAALMDTLGVQSAGVIGLDAGGPVALEFALRYPGRTWGLVLLSARTTRQPEDPEAPLKVAAGNKFIGEIGSWFFAETASKDPGRALNMMMDSDSTLSPAARREITDFVLASSDQCDLLREFISTLVPLSARWEGLRNDLHNLQNVHDFPYHLLGMPVLVINGQEDGVEPLAAAKDMAGRIPNASTLFPEGAGHMLLLGPASEAVNAGMTGFLRLYSAGESQP